MALKIKCEYCKKNIDAGASRCPFCHGEYTPEQMARRKKETNQGMAAGCLVLLILVGLIGMCSGGDKDSPDATTSASAAAAEKDGEWAKAGSASKEMEAKVLAFGKAVGAAMRPCDQRSTDLKDVVNKMQKGDASIYDAFGIAKSAEETCRTSWSEVDDIDVPDGLPAVAEDAAKKSIEACGFAMISKQKTASVITEILDGDTKPSRMQEMKENADAAGAATISCAASIISVSGAVGVDLEKAGKSLN